MLYIIWWFCGLVNKSYLPLMTLRTVTHQTSLSMGFSRKEYWSGLPFPTLGDPPHPGIQARSPALHVDSLQAKPQGKSIYII